MFIEDEIDINRIKYEATTFTAGESFVTHEIGS